MRIDELTRSETRKIVGTNWEIPQMLQRWLVDRGFQQIGRGNFSVVFGRPGSEKVIKITTHPEIECAYLFAKISRRQRFKHFPIVYNVKEFGGPSAEYAWAGGGGFFVVIMERLHPFDPFLMRWSTDPEYNLGLAIFLHKSEPRGGTKAITKDELPKVLQTYADLSGERLEQVISNIQQEDEEFFGKFSQNIIKNWNQEYKNDSLVKALDLLEAEVIRNDCTGLDLKRENLMLRADGTLVLLDPLPN